MTHARKSLRLTRFAVAFITLALALSLPSAHAMPPAHGLSAADAADAADVLEAATKRGVGDLPASPFLKQTRCGLVTGAITRNARAHRTALISLRRARFARAGTRIVRAGEQRVRRARAGLRIAQVRKRRICSPEAARTIRDVDEGTTLRGTTTTERPRSVVSGRAMAIARPIEFADVRANRTAHSPSRYRDLLFGENYPHGGGSLASYYEDMSYGAFTVDGDVAGWRRMPKRRAAYATDNGGMGAYPGNSQRLLEDAVRANDASINFAKYDNDGPDRKPNSGDDDGFVDTVFLVYAGSSAAENGNLDALWPHAWQRTVATRDRSANGGFVKVGRYAAVPERMTEAGPDGDLLTVGVVAHEYGHVLGLPDLIDGEGGHAGPGDWDLMATGVWGFEHSSRPSGLSAWSRARLGWVTPQLLEGDHVAHRLEPSYAQRTIVKLPIADTPLHEHFLVERRTRTGFDADAPADGLLVWHVDDSVAADDASRHPRVELVAADGAVNGDSGDLLAGADALSDSSTPNTRAHDGDASLVAIQNVQAETVDLHAGRASLAPVIDAAIDAAGPQAAPPTATLSTPADGARVRGIVTMTCDANGAPNIKTVQFRRANINLASININPNAATVTQTYGWDSTTVADGAQELNCRARNTSNQWSAASSITVVVDNTVPAAPTISTPTIGAWVRGTVTWTATGTDNYGVTRFSYLVDGVDNWQGPWAEISPATNGIAWDTTLVTNGAHSLTVRSEDLAGNQSALSGAVAVNVDNALPTMPAPDDGSALPDIDLQASSTTLDANWAAGSDTDSGIAGYDWRFCTTTACGTIVASGSSAGLVASAGALTLADGSTYYACVRPTDVAGNQGVEQCSDGVMVDSTAPVMTLPDDGAAAPDVDWQTSTSTLEATWAAANDGAGSGVASYGWRFCTTTACGTILASGSGAGTSATASALTLTDAATYYACVQAVDQASNASGYVCSDGITVDVTAPLMGTPLDGTAAPDVAAQSSTSVLDANWPAAADGGGSGVVGYDWQFCTTPVCGTVLVSGSGAGTSATASGLTLVTGSTYYACVRARDGVALVSPYVCSDGVLVDDGPPTMSVPTDGAVAPDIDFQTSATVLDALWGAASDGGSGIADYDWRFCTTTACGTIVASGSGTGLSASATGLTLADGVTYYACVRASDVAGNLSAYQCSDGVTVDQSAPLVTAPNDGAAAPDIDAQASTTTLDANWVAAGDGTGSGVASYDWRFCTTTACGTILASGSGSGTATSANATGLALTIGTTYYACIRATDQLGATSAWACSDGVTIDGPPTVTIGAPTSGATVTGTVAVNATGTDVGGITSFEFRLDGVLQATFGPLVAMSPRSVTWNWDTSAVAEGSHVIDVTTYDDGGLTDTDTITVTVDRTAPTTSHGGIAAGSTVNGVINLTSSSTDATGIDRVDYWIDGATAISTPAGGATSFTDPGTPFNTAILLDGNHGYRVKTYDTAGNAATSNPTTLFIVNNNAEGVAPSGSIASPAAGALPPSNVTLSANVADNNVIVRVEFLLDGAAIAGVAPFVAPPGFSNGVATRTWSNTSGVAAGPHTISARITDASGNQFTTPVVNVTK